jgi:hypothetical protein
MRRALRGGSARSVSGRTVAPPQQQAEGKSLPAPVGGWDSVSQLADMPADRAVALDNWEPLPDSVKVRRGNQVHGTGMGSDAVESLMVYEGLTSTASKMFAVSNGTIWDVSASGIATSAVTSLQNDRWQYVNFTTAGGKFLWACNGVDTPRRYNGSSWTTVSVTGVTAGDIINVNAHKNRLWFAFVDSTKAGYLGTQAIEGSVATIELGAIFTRGGYLVGMSNLTRDGGSGMDDFATFLSSRGQVAMFQGTDPSSSSTWSHVGTFDVGRPLGRRCFCKIGGGIALINIDGVVPLPQALSIQRESVAGIAITKKINNAMNEAARSYANNFGWELTPYPKGAKVILNVPIAENDTQHQYVMNALTGKWCRFTGWPANCFAVYQDNLYFGANDGTVRRADYTSNDITDLIDAQGQAAYNYYGARGRLKNFSTARAIVTTDSSARPSIGMSTDFKDNATLGTPGTAAVASALYDSAIYDTDVYAVEGRSLADWATMNSEGYCASIHFRSIVGQTGLSVWGVSEWGSDWSQSFGEIDVRVNAFDVTFHRGAFM